MRVFSKIYKEDLDTAGKKAVELGELARLGIPIPDGFVITTAFFEKFLRESGIDEKIKEIQKINHPAIRDCADKLFDPIRQSIIHEPISQNLSSQFYAFYSRLTDLFNESAVNIFTSSENNRSISYPNIIGDANLLMKIKEIWALQIHKPAAIVVQKNINSKLRGSTATSDPPKELKHLADKIQKHFYFPQNLEYAIEKDKIYITNIQPFTPRYNTSAITQRADHNAVSAGFGGNVKLLIRGVSINSGIATGPVRVFKENHGLIKIKNGEIAVLPRLNISKYGKLKRAKAIVTDIALGNSYDRMIYKKDFKIPTIEGTKIASKIFQNGNVITVNGVSGEIYRGSLI